MSRAQIKIFGCSSCFLFLFLFFKPFTVHRYNIYMKMVTTFQWDQKLGLSFLIRQLPGSWDFLRPQKSHRNNDVIALFINLVRGIRNKTTQSTCLQIRKNENPGEGGLSSGYLEQSDDSAAFFWMQT